MEKAHTGVHNSESNLIVSCVDTDIDELSKEKEEELLFGAEEEGDDEDTLSDDSLRLRLSDDDDIEREDATRNDINTAKLKLKNTIVEKTLCSDVQQSVEVSKHCDDEEAVEEEHNTAINVPENSALPLDECTSENKQIQDSTHNSENTNAIINESNEKCTLESNINLTITDVNDARFSAAIEQHTALENDNLFTNNRVQTNVRDAELTIQNKENLKETANDSKEIMTTDSCELKNKVDINIDSNDSRDSANVNISNSEKSSTITIISNNNDDNLGDKIIDKDIKDDNHLLKRSQDDLNNGSDCVDLVKSDNSNDSLSHKDILLHKSKNKNSEPANETEGKNVSNMSKVTDKLTNTSLKQNQNNLSNVEDNMEVTIEDDDIDKSETTIVDKKSSVLQDILLSPISADNSNKSNNGTKNDQTVVSRKKRIRKTIDTVQNHEDKQEERESGRQKRKTAKNAEEIIRKKYLNSDSDSNDSTELITVNHKLKKDIRPASPPSLKRSSENEVCNGNIKKLRMNSEEKKDITQLSFIEKFFRRDLKAKLPKLTQEELEELLIQKIVETITMRSEIGHLREQARLSEKYQEITRTRMQQLMKQVKDFKMVLERNEIDRRANPDKSVAPIKINRSVGLQVNFITEHGVQNLRQATNLKSVTTNNTNATNTTNTTNTTSTTNTANTTNATNATNATNNSTSTETTNNIAISPRRGIKIRSPVVSRPVVTMTTPIVTQTSVQTTVIPTVTPAALVVAKPLDPPALTLSTQSTSNLQPILPAPQQQIQSQSHQTIVLNGKIQNQVNRPPLIAPKPRNDFIDLTDEEEKNKSNAKVTTTATSIIESSTLNVTSKPVQSFQRVIQAIPANVAIATTQPASIKVIATNQPSAQTLVNNVNPPRVAYVMQSGTGSPRQVLIANTNQQVQIRPVNAPNNKSPFSTVTYKTGISTITNGAVRVLATPVLSNIQISKHPAALPDIPSYAVTPGWKLPPPAPSLKISKVSNGIVLSWNMTLSDKYADIASYQLYAYQEVAGVNPSTSLWKKVGDVRALPLPMACTLTQFSEGNNYYFAVRAVDTHSRKGQYSLPGNISL
ncbi:activating transcription factor 7-interacting protein 1 isoform X2 [Solenopsis invicta]|uniref:activating transcription factor 7-interacting protein 1 isoform X2 n=1 Tax=Solenopsis invicta TaxID=13686 RepID=UPI000E33F1EF|nr:activating transcription factor 7-interacting protein 1 isoform X2 [Solenopsis invicta]